MEPASWGGVAVVVAVDVDSASLSVLVPEHAASDAKANALSPMRTAVEGGRIDVEKRCGARTDVPCR